MNQDRPSKASSHGASSDPAQPAIPDHDMLRRIGQGSYGEVWLARDLMGEHRAVKVVYRSRFSGDRPFDREYEGVRRFGRISQSHPSQLSVLHVGRGAGSFYYVMELADDATEITDNPPRGQRGDDITDSPGSRDRCIDPDSYAPKTLRSLMRLAGGVVGDGPGARCALPVSQCVEIGVALASGLAHLHNCGLVHRDIKPANIIFVNGLPKLADIGLIAGADEERSVVGTEGYMAPEGQGGVPADIYALGKVLYEMATGLDAKRFPDLPDEWSTRPDREDLRALNQVIQWACEGRADRRYKSAQAMRADLELLRTHSSLRYRKLRRGARALGVLSAVAVLLLVGSIFAVQFLRKRAVEEGSRAAEESRRASEESRRAGLERVRASRRPPITSFRAGWFTNQWWRLEEAAAIRPDEEVQQLATALLTGLDARLVAVTNEPAASAAFSANGECLVGGVGTDGVPLLIDDLGEVTKLPALGEGPVGWSPEGTPLQLVACSNRVVLYEVRTGGVRREFPLPDAERASVVAMTPEGSLIAAGLTNRVLVWDTATSRLLGEVPAHATALAFSPDGALLAAGAADGTTCLYAMPALERVSVLSSPLGQSQVTCLAFGRDALVRRGDVRPTNSWLLATGEQGGGIVIWDLRRGLPRSFCRGSTWTVLALAFAPDGLTLASAGRVDARLWDVASGEVLLLLPEASTGGSRALAFDAQGRRVVYGGELGDQSKPKGARAALWELESHRGINALRGLSCAARKVWFSANSQRLAALSDDWHLAIWDLARQRLLFVFETPEGVYADNAGGAFDAGGDRFAFATATNACLYDLTTGAVERRWSLADGAADQLEFDGQVRPLLLRRERPSEAPGEQRRIWRLYELGSSKKPTLLCWQTDTNWYAQEMLFQPGGKRFVVWNGGNKGTNRIVRVFDVKDGREVWKSETELFEGELRMCIDPKGDWFAYTVDLDGRRRLVRFEGFATNPIPDQQFQAIGPSAEAAAYFGKPSWLYLYQKGTRQAIPLATDWTALGDPSAFSPDGKLLAWGTEEGIVLVAEIERVQAELARLRRN